MTTITTTPKTYMEAYRERMQNNNDLFVDIAGQLKAKGFDCYAAKDGLISFIKIVGNEKQITFGFGEVPYNFHLYYDIDYRLGHGSSKGIKAVNTTENPFTFDEIISLMQPVVKVQVPHTNYLRLL